MPTPYRLISFSSNRLLCLLAPLAAILLLAGCSGPPSESIGQSVLEKRIQAQSNGQIKLTSFKKTNATGDENSYQMEFEAEIEFLSTGTWSRGVNGAPDVSFEFSAGQTQQGGMMGFAGSIFGATAVKAGEHTTVKGVLRFAKTEQGWRDEAGDVH